MEIPIVHIGCLINHDHEGNGVLRYAMGKSTWVFAAKLWVAMSMLNKLDITPTQNEE